MKWNQHPPGAILLEEFNALLECARQGEDIRLYSVSHAKRRFYRRILNQRCYIAGNKLFFFNLKDELRTVQLAHRGLLSKSRVRAKGYFFTNYFHAIAYAYKKGVPIPKGIGG
jgi:hypothetical protein